MTPLDTWVQTPAARALGWTLVHFVWEGAAIALGLAAALRAVRSSRARYAAACLAMLGMLAAFGVTYARLIPTPAMKTGAYRRLANCWMRPNRVSAFTSAGTVWIRPAVGCASISFTRSTSVSPRITLSASQTRKYR